MCNRNNNNDKKDFETSDNFDKSLQEFKSNFRSLTKSVFDLTNESINEFNNRTKGFADALLMDDDDVNNEFKNTINRIFNRNNENWEFPSVYENHTNHFHKQFGFPYLNRHLMQKFGLISYNTPSIRNFNDCRDKNGQQLWDSNGYWRCLFPNSEIPNKLLELKQQHFSNQILTKEDFENELQAFNYSKSSGQYDFGEKGIFFKQYEDFMNWKSLMYKNLKEQRRQHRRERHQWCHDNSGVPSVDKNAGSQHNGLTAPESLTDLNGVNMVETSEPTENKVISTSSLYDYSSHNDSDTVYKKTKTERFSDGTSVTTTVMKTKPFGSNEWQITENVENNKNGEISSSSRVISDPDSTNSKSKGWFWN